MLSIRGLSPFSVLLIFLNGLVKDALYYFPLGFSSLYYLTICLTSQRREFQYKTSNKIIDFFIFFSLILMGIIIHIFLNLFLVGSLALPPILEWVSTLLLYTSTLLLYTSSASLKH